MRIITILISFIVSMFSAILLFFKLYNKGKKDAVSDQNDETLEEISNVTKDKANRDMDSIDSINKRLLNKSRSEK